MVRQVLALALCGSVTAGCASASGSRVPQVPPAAPVQDTAVLADYVQRIPAGSRVRVERSGGGVLRGTLMKASPEHIVVQKNTRVPETPVEIPLSEITRVSLDTGSSSAGKSIGIGLAAGAAGAVGVLLVLAAIFAGG